MNREYFRNCSNDNIKLFARYHAYQLGGECKFDTIQDIMNYLDDVGGVGDTSLEVLHEDSNNVVFLSTDSCTKVVVNVVKDNFQKSESIELC